MLKRNTKEDNKEIEEKLKSIGLDFKKVPKSLLNINSIKYKPIKSYEDNNYKIYKYVDVKDIEILITPVDRLDDLNDKLKKARPLVDYIDKNNKETIEEQETFIEMIKDLNVERFEEIEEEQKEFEDKIPYDIKYQNNYIWQIYYSDIDDRYFMLHSSNERNSEALFYLIKKKLERKKTRIYIPISHLEYSNKVLNKTEITDLENYLWFFTKEWPNIYEVYDKDDRVSLQIIGKTKVYNNVKSTYKISLKNKEEAGEFYKLIKALFILESNDEMQYDFKPILNENGTLDFCYNLKKINYNSLSEFIRQEVEVNQEKIEKIENENILNAEKLEILRETVNKQKEEYLLKEKQIANFLECKKTFFGRVKFFFKKGKSIKKNDNSKQKDALEENKQLETIHHPKIEKKKLYTIEDLLTVCFVYKDVETKFKNMEMDIKALENKKESLERKINNATLYINEIESHKKSIFDFWKFTNKDESNMLTEGEEKQEESINKIKKVFKLEEDIEEFGKKIDAKQREAFSKNECDAIFAISNDLKTFNTVGKEKILKKDEHEIERILKKYKTEYENSAEELEKKDFDIFGNVFEDSTKIKTLNNNKHREIPKDKFKILDVRSDTTTEEYINNIKNYRELIKEAYGKVLTPYDMELFKTTDENINEDSYEILDLNLEAQINNKTNKETSKLYKLNIKENMPVIFYSNIMFYDNMNKTLPEGMDVETKALIDLNKFKLKLISRKSFYTNTLKNEFENEIKTFEVYEYDVDLKDISN